MGKAGKAGRTTKKKKTRLRFFKVFFPGLNSKRLDLPPAYRKHVRTMRPASTCLLTGPSRNVWPVDVIKNAHGVFFQNGWEEFVRDHSLQTGEFLIFEYQGGSRFSVLIFDASMCEKEGAFGACSSSRGLVGSVEGIKAWKTVKEEPFPCVSSQDNFTASRKRKRGIRGRLFGRLPPRRGDASPKPKRKPGKKHYLGSWMSQRRPVTEVEIKEAYQAACSFKSMNPFVVLVMRKYDVYYGYMKGIPRSFSRQYLPDNQKMILWDPIGKPWPVNYLSCNGRYCFCGGWRKFALANYLEQDDACVLELIKANEIQVHIFRVVEEIKPLLRKVKF